MKRHGWRLTWCGAWTWAALAATPAAAQPRPATASTNQPAADPATAVQLAWMSDPALFPYSLTARVGGAGVVVSGFVPNERVQWQAVRTAQRATTLNVIDELKLNPRLPVPTSAPANAAELEHQAAAAVTTALGARANNIMVYGDRSGRVTLTGAVASTEDLLTAAACLRRLPGCGCVDNRLSTAEPTGIITVAATLPPIVRPTPAVFQTVEPPLVTASVPAQTDGPALPEPTTVAPATPPVLRKEAAASAKALPRPETPKRQPPPVTLLASATRLAGESDSVLPAVVLRPSPVLAAPAGDVAPSATKPPATAPEKPSPHPSTPPAPPTPPQIIGAEHLRASFDAACHGLAGDIQVQLVDEHHVAVSLRLRSMLDWDWVRSRIRTVAEAAGLAVTFNVAVKPW